MSAPDMVSVSLPKNANTISKEPRLEHSDVTGDPVGDTVGYVFEGATVGEFDVGLVVGDDEVGDCVGDAVGG